MMKNIKMVMILGILLMMPIIPNAQSYRRGLTMITPAEQWREALPSGNGTIGALVFGSVAKERVVFNHNELWYRGRVTEIPDISAELPVLRQLLMEGKYLEAPEVGYQTNEYYFGDELGRTERPHILWKDGKPEYLFLACLDKLPSAGFYLKIEDWK